MRADILNKLTLEEKRELLAILEEKNFRDTGKKFFSIFPDTGDLRRELYPKHISFFNAGYQYKQRLFMAANRVGKTFSAGYELVCHLTGRYPKWWTGRRFTQNNFWWVAGKDAKLVKSVLQDALLGPVGSFGTGLLPRDCIDFDTLKDAQKADTTVGTFRVKHITGTYSTVEFKTYEAGRTSFEGTAKSIWFDEEPPLPVYTEGLLRTMTNNGPDENILMMTFTPLKGISETVMGFLDGSEFKSGEISTSKWVEMATWDDVPHLSEKAKAEMLESIPPFQRDARSKGIPSLGAGVIYPVPESEYLIDPITIPDNWPRYGGLDVGWNRTGAVWLAKDPNTNIHYLYSEHYRGQAEASVHAEAIKARGQWIPMAIDTAARGRTQTDGDSLYNQYTNLGLNIQNANKAVETGLATVWELLSGGQIKVFKTCTNFMDEIRLYRRDEKGNVVKSNDHLMDAFRYAIMTGREAAKVNPAFAPKSPGYNHNVPSRPWRI